MPVAFTTALTTALRVLVSNAVGHAVASLFSIKGAVLSLAFVRGRTNERVFAQESDFTRQVAIRVRSITPTLTSEAVSLQFRSDRRSNPAFCGNQLWPHSAVALVRQHKRLRDCSNVASWPRSVSRSDFPSRSACALIMLMCVRRLMAERVHGNAFFSGLQQTRQQVSGVCHAIRANCRLLLHTH